jgi:hypothetical protein
VHDHNVCLTAVRETAAHRRRARRSTGNHEIGSLTITVVPLGHDDNNEVSDRAGLADATSSDGFAVDQGELLRPAKTSSSARGHHDGRDGHV